jgi:hypothetical protein
MTLFRRLARLVWGGKIHRGWRLTLCGSFPPRQASTLLEVAIAAAPMLAAATRAAGAGVPELWLAESLPVLSSEVQSRRGRIITRMATTDTDHTLITDHPAAACGTATPGCLLASYELT